MKKTIPALVAAFLITTILATGMLLFGQDALVTAKASAAPYVNASAAAQIQQLLVGYQTREIQYQQQLKSAATEISVANQQISAANQQIDQADRQIQQYQLILSQLENRGLITIAADGAITVH